MPMPCTFTHRHLLDIESLSRADIETILALAARYAEQNRGSDKKSARLAGKTVVNLFFEHSTRTRSSFEIAAKRLSADVVNVPVEFSSIKKGETLLDTVAALDAMRIDGLVIRHPEDGVPQSVAAHMRAHVINAGDGKHEHPTQALLDALTILRHKKKFDGLTVALCGDIAHSRVARSNAHLLTKLGAAVRMIAPPCFAAPNFGNLGVECVEDVRKGLAGADAVIALRIQHERIGDGEHKISPQDYARSYRIDHAMFAAAKPDAIIMHPGPVNRGVELSSELADDPDRSVIREQVEMGVAVRMAVMDLLLSGGNA